MNQSVAMVTGTSRGIGRATTIRVARDFSAVVVVARSSETLQETASNVQAEGAEPLAVASICASPADAHPRQRVAVLDSDLSHIDTGAGDRMRLGSH